MDSSPSVKAFIICLAISAGMAQAVLAQGLLGHDKEPNIEGVDSALGREAPLKKSPLHNEAAGINALLEAYALASNGKTPDSWDDIERAFGEAGWPDRVQYALVKRRYDFTNVSGHINGGEEQFDGVLLVTSHTPQNDPRSNERGRYTVWKLASGMILLRWFDETELQTFTKWSEVEERLDARRVEKLTSPTLSNQQPETSGAVSSERWTPSKRAPRSNATATSEPERSEPESASPLPWLIGIAVIGAIIIGAIVMRRKA